MVTWENLGLSAGGVTPMVIPCSFGQFSIFTLSGRIGRWISLKLLFDVIAIDCNRIKVFFLLVVPLKTYTGPLSLGFKPNE